MPLRALARRLRPNGQSPSKKDKVLDTQLKRTLAWVSGSNGNVYTLVLNYGGSCVITCGGVVVRNCRLLNPAESMEILMAMAAADGTK